MLKIFAFALLVASASASFWSACSDLPGVETADNVQGSSCSAILNRCVATRGQTLTLDIFFTPFLAHESLPVAGVIQHDLLTADVPVTFSPENSNACNNLLNAETEVFMGCPATPHVRKLWRVTMNVPNLPAQLPAVTGATLRLTMARGDTNAVIGCTNVRVDVV